MALDPRLWRELERSGLSNAHLELLLRFFAAVANGKIIWHSLRGRLEKCEIQLSFASRPFDVRKVSEAMLPPDG